MNKLTMNSALAALFLLACSSGGGEATGESEEAYRRHAKRPAPTTPTTAPTTTPTTAPATSPASATCSLKSSGAIVVTTPGAVIENLRIATSSGPGIDVRADNVVVRNVVVEHASGPGIVVTSASGVTIENVDVRFTNAPAKGPNPDASAINIQVYDAPNLTVTNARVAHGSSGVYLLESPGSHLSYLAGTDFRGPFPRGQLVQWDKSPNGVLEHFSVVNDGAVAWTEDNVNVYQSTNMIIRDGLVDGNNSPSGVGVIFDGGNADGLVEDVDAVHMGNGCFSAIEGNPGITFRRTRCRDNICGSQQGRGKPLSNALMWAGSEDASGFRIEQSSYTGSCNDNLVWPEESFAVVELTEQAFVTKTPVANAFCWE